MNMLLALVVILLLPWPAHSVDTAAYRLRASAGNKNFITATEVAREVEFGRDVAARVLGHYNYHPDDTAQKYINLVGRTITRNLNRPELDFHFAVIQSDMINAFSAPGGYIFVSTGALKLVENEAELAALLSHEISHVVDRHILSELNLRGDDDQLSGVASLLGGASKSVEIAFSQTVDKAVDILFRDGYKKEHEIEADRHAASYLALAGYDPEGLISLLRKVEKVKGKTGKTYPSYSERYDTIKNSIATEAFGGMLYFTGTERFKSSYRNERSTL
ncbi:MAG: M48 family metalloprotease [Desulfuromonadaceae bacterium]|nr:M48 family metalloprotease [Desulfuromonadaceae bacterium]MDD5107199.1 M48 family metalloprotease [Desulfuromonadaceae bacterium]